MKLFHCAALMALAAALASIGIAARSEVPSGNVPVEIALIEGTVGADNTVRYRVTLDDVAKEDQPVQITNSGGSPYSSCPASVTVPEGRSSVSFSATISNDPPVAWTIFASANGTSVLLMQTIDPSN